MRTMIITGILLSVISCSHYKTVSAVLESKGFCEKRPPFCQISNGKITKNNNSDVVALFEVLKTAAIVSTPPETTTSYVMFLENGSSSPKDVIAVHVSKTGEGHIEYVGKTVAHFKNVEFYNACESAFMRSDIVIRNSNTSKP